MGSLWKWKPRRQGGGYRKMLLARGKSFDLYLIDYPPGVGVPYHLDPVKGKRHYRANFVLRGSRAAFRTMPFASWDVGGFLWTALGERLTVFRPDAVGHGCSEESARRVPYSHSAGRERQHAHRSDSVQRYTAH